MQGRLRSRLILLLFFFNESTTQRYVDRGRYHESLSLWNIFWLAPTLCQFPNRLHYAANQTNKSFTLRLRTCKGIRIPESGKYLLVESRFHNTAQGIRNPTRNSNRENGPTFLDFALFLGIFQWEEPTKRVPFTAEPEIPKFWLNGKRPRTPLLVPPLHAISMQKLPSSRIIRCGRSTCIECISADLKDSVFIKMRRWRWRRSDDLWHGKYSIASLSEIELPT